MYPVDTNIESSSILDIGGDELGVEIVNIWFCWNCSSKIICCESSSISVRIARMFVNVL